jgi:hypothetical protein
MDFIFTNGEKLYKKEKQKCIDFLEKVTGNKLTWYQKDIIHKINLYNTQMNCKNDYTIYGDDFKLDILGKNINGEFSMKINDYDENQEIENDVVISFSKQELSTFILILQNIYNQMEV